MLLLDMGRMCATLILAKGRNTQKKRVEQAGPLLYYSEAREKALRIEASQS
jgi:hypothetical protein